MVLGYDFMDEAKLERLLVRSNLVPEVVSVYAPSMISKFKHQLGLRKDSPLVSIWIDQLTRFQRYLSEGVAKSTGPDAASVEEIVKGVPSYLFFEGREVLSATPFEAIYFGSRFVIGQFMDPVTGNFGLIQELTSVVQTIRVGARKFLFIDSKDLNRAAIAQVRVDRAATSDKYKFQEESPRGDLKPLSTEDAFFFMSNGRPMLLARPSDQPDRGYSIVPLEITGVAEGDQFSFRRRRFQHQDKHFQIFFINRRKARTKKTDIWVVALRESSHDNLLEKEFVRKIYDSNPMSMREMDLRIVEFENDVLFDNITTVNGPAEYLKGGRIDPIVAAPPNYMALDVPRKTVPYLRVMAPLGGDQQKYLRSLSVSTLIPGLLTYRSFDPKGAREEKTGFYMVSKSTEALKHGIESFYPGKPLLASAS